jgi:hypothetical protein
MEFPRGARFTPPKLRFWRLNLCPSAKIEPLVSMRARSKRTVSCLKNSVGMRSRWVRIIFGRVTSGTGGRSPPWDAHGPAGPAHNAAANTMLAMASRYDPPDWRLSAVTMVAKPFHDRAAAAPEAKTANVSNATAITTNWSATAVALSCPMEAEARRARDGSAFQCPMSKRSGYCRGCDLRYWSGAFTRSPKCAAACHGQRGL